MGMADITALAGAVGPTAAILLYLVLQGKGKATPSDPVKDLAEALGAIRERLIVLETIVSRMDRRGDE